MPLYTVLGANGFVGSALVRHLRARGHECQAVGRQDALPQHLGHAIYCIGLTSDFRARPFDTMEAHVSLLSDFLRAANFKSFTYLSSTRVYLRLPPDGVADEQTPLIVDPHDSDDIYNLSKLAGESLCLSVANPAVRVVRLSNVYGGTDPSENFLTTILRQLMTRGKATFFNSMCSQKDYIAIDDVRQALELLPVRASSRVVNLASGRNVNNQELAALLQKHVGMSVDVLADAPDIMFPRISIERLTREVGVHPKDLADQFAGLVKDFRASLQGQLAAAR